jgi:hypothetical protein
MEDEKMKVERLRAKAQWELLKLQLRAGRVSADEVQQAEQVWRRIGAEQRRTEALPLLPPSAKVKVAIAEKPMVAWTPDPVREPETVSPEAASLIAELERDRSAVDVAKREVSMQLQQVPLSVPCPELTSQILDLRKQWEEIGDRIVYVKRFGELPVSSSAQDETFFPVAFTQQLPKDKFALDRMMKNLSINVRNKWPEKLAKAKTVAKKAEYERKIAVGEAQLGVMRELFATL